GPRSRPDFFGGAGARSSAGSGCNRSQSASTARTPPDMTENELAAAAKLRAAAAALGIERTELLLLLIVDDCRWAVICAVAGVGDLKPARDGCAEARAALAAWLAGRPGPDPPRRRPCRRAGEPMGVQRDGGRRLKSVGSDPGHRGPSVRVPSSFVRI